MSDAKLFLDKPVGERNTGWEGKIKPVYSLPALMRAWVEGVEVTLENKTGTITGIVAESGCGRSWLVTLRKPSGGFWLFKTYTSETVWIYAEARNVA